MNFTAKLGWWAGALLLAVGTRQALFGFLPLAVFWYRQQMAQASQAIDQKLSHYQSAHLQFQQNLNQRFAQLDRQVSQVYQRIDQLDRQMGQVHGRMDDLQSRFDPQPPTTAPLIHAIQDLQKRLHRVNLQTVPQVSDLQAQVAQLQNRVDHLAQGVVLRQGVGVFIDGANLHASARRLGVGLDYATLIPRLLPKDVQDTPVTVHFYSGWDADNWQQQQLHRDLQQMGIQVHTKSVTRFADGHTKANMDGQMIVDLLTHSFAHVFLLSGDGDFLPALETLHRQGVKITVAAFAPHTHQPLQGQFPFRDLCKMGTAKGKVIPLPVKQSSYSAR
ncbi:MAG: NYN domain-containing protein [Gloeomargarita sp. DG_2_bins_126]